MSARQYIGMRLRLVAAFAGIFAAVALSEGDFVQPSATLVFGAAGAGLGYLGGWAVRGVGQNALIYRSPEEVRGN